MKRDLRSEPGPAAPRGTRPAPPWFLALALALAAALVPGCGSGSNGGDALADVEPDPGPPDLGPEQPCVPDCTTRNCGTDGCGGTCGQCTSGNSCLEGLCVQDHCLPGWDQIPKGTFTMGSPDSEPGRAADEGPQHEVTLSHSYCMDSAETTVTTWKLSFATAPDPPAGCTNDCPVTRVSWWEALAFANAWSASAGLPPCYELTGCTGTPGDGAYTCTGVTFKGVQCQGYRLPTEAEWERASRAGTTTATSAGDLPSLDNCDASGATWDLLSPYSWYCANSVERPHLAGGKKGNPFGCHDLMGNVNEWVWDAYAAYPAGPATDPALATGAQRIVRGGSHVDTPAALRAAARRALDPGARAGTVGFRLVRTLP